MGNTMSAVYKLVHGDCLEIMEGMPEDSVDLVIGSPPYEDARVYGELRYNLTGQDWVDWMFKRVVAATRICRGLCVFVIEGRTRKFAYSATPHLLAADLHRAGIVLRHDVIYRKSAGMSGSGGPDWFRNDFEFCLCVTKGGKLPHSDNLACGAPMKYKRGGEFSNRSKSGERANKYDVREYPTVEIANPGNVVTETAPCPYCDPALSNVFDVTVGGGHMGSALASENEAPFPEALAERFVLSCSYEGDTVCDPFCGSGTSGAVSVKNGRRFLGIDCRTSQIELTERRLKECL